MLSYIGMHIIISPIENMNGLNNPPPFTLNINKMVNIHNGLIQIENNFDPWKKSNITSKPKIKLNRNLLMVIYQFQYQFRQRRYAGVQTMPPANLAVVYLLLSQLNWYQ